MSFDLPSQNLAASNLIILPMSHWQTAFNEISELFHAGDIWQATDWEKPLPVKELRYIHAFAAQTAVKKGKLIAIPHADTMQREAANTLLKLLEEPPPGVTIILFAETENVLPTIRSRVRVQHRHQIESGSSVHQKWRELISGYALEDPRQRATARRLLFYSPLLHATVQSDLIFEAFQPNIPV